MKSLSPPILVPTLALLALPVALFASGRRHGVPVPSQASSVPDVQGLFAPQASGVVAAAEAFAATLTAEQRTKVQSDMTMATVSRWSNLPTGFVPRNGLRLGNLKPAQLAAALRLARTALGEDGYARFEEIRAADDLLARNDRGGGPGGPGGGRPGGPPGGGPPGGGGPGGGGFGGPPEGGGATGGNGSRPDGSGGPRGPGGPGGLDYGAGNYYVAFLGKPSATTPWMLQVGGHHLAFNLYYRGATGTATPYFVGTEPTTWTDAKGKTHAPLAPMRDAMAGLLASLTPEQKTAARLTQRFSDVYLGPRANGRFPAESAGVPVANLSPESQALVRRAIAAWTGDNASAAAYRKLYDAELARTKVAFSGDPALKAHGDYVRIDGPHVWIEFVCQDGIVYRQKIHYHTIWRDRKTDYGASYAF